MRKLFLLLPALALSLLVNAADQYPDPSVENSLSAAVIAVGDGETIYLDDATPYFNVKKEGVDYTKLRSGKHITFRAIEGKHPVIKYEVPFQVREAVNAKFIGVKFDGTNLSSYDNYFHLYDDAANVLEFEDCEFCSLSKYCVSIPSGKNANAIIITNCYFHNNSNRAVINQGTIGSLSITNSQFESLTTDPAIDNYGSGTITSLAISGCDFANNSSTAIHESSGASIGSCAINNCTFYDITSSAIFLENTADNDISVANCTFKNINASSLSAGVVESKTASGSFTVDHCTFYNCIVKNTDYGTVKVASPNAVVSNCIFAMPESTGSQRTVYVPSGLSAGTTVTNCIMYNYTKDSNIGIPSRSGLIITNCNASNPLFTDAANGDFSLAGNWVTMELSPARSAATDGSDLGDPRWYSAETLPSTDFATPYAFVGGKAVIAGNIWYDGTNDYLYYNDKSECGTATWKITATRACAIGATLNMNAENASGHKFKVEIIDAEGNSIGEVAEASQSSASGDIALPSSIVLPAAGNYTIKLFNLTGWSSAKINSITLSYLGGAVVPVAADANTTLNVADAWFNTGATRADGTITYSSWNSADSWIKWNIATSETKFYDISMRINTTNAHRCTVAIYEDEAADPVATVQESYSETTGDALDIEIGRVNLVGGKNYVVKVTNPVSGSAAKIASVTFAPVVATSTALPNTLNFSNAVLSPKAHITDGMLYFNTIGDTDPRGQWAQWEVTTGHNGLFLFTMGVTSTNEQSYKITILDNSKNELEYFEANPGTGNKTIKHYFNLASGTYFVKVENTYSYSKGHLTSLVVTEPAGVVTLDENATDNSAWASKVNDGNQYDVQIIRSFRGGMYNTFCLPFAVSETKLKDVFGSDVQVFTLGEATIEDQVLDLTINPASDIYQGTPVLIKPSSEIANPIFIDVQFSVAAAVSTSKTNADFVGSFVKKNITASEDLLYVGAYDKLYFLSVDYAMPGLRAWFVIHDLPSALHSPRALKGMRLSERNKMPTDIQPIETPNNARKVLRNGQLYILRDGVIYNMTGARVQ